MRRKKMKCLFCQNEDPLYFATFQDQIYCRKCIHLRYQKQSIKESFVPDKAIHARLSYSLTTTQKRASMQILNGVIQKKTIMVHAVCGAGKTELVYQAMEYILQQGKAVGFAIPRKDVVLEIFQRLRHDYPMIRICCVYGGHHDDLNGQLVVLTTHQLFRYRNYFDLLILDEADAFPYANNAFLESFLHQSVRGSVLYLSATMNVQKKEKDVKIIQVNKRFHQHDLPLPQFVFCHFFNQLNILNKQITLFRLTRKPCLIFVPTIRCGKKLERQLHIPFVYAGCPEKIQWIHKLKSKEIFCLLTTSILERGITIENIQVIVFEADHPLFDLSTLIQIAGRVGRKKNAPDGTILFLAKKQTKEMKQCIRYVKEKNLATV